MAPGAVGLAANHTDTLEAFQSGFDCLYGFPVIRNDGMRV